MAESCSIENKSLEELEGEITCGICQEHYTEPKILPCLHYYCKQCILGLAQSSAAGKPFYCPECRCAATLPEGGVDQLKTAFFINRLKSKVTTIERVQGKVEVKCELCVDAGNAEAFCRQCAMFICKECVLLHSKVKAYTNHAIASLDDLKHGRAKGIQPKESPVEKCTIHEEPLILICFDCGSLICQHCTLKDHRDHNFEFTKKAAPMTKTKFLDHLKPLKVLYTNLVQRIKNVNTARLEVEDQKKSSINFIQGAFKELRDILDKREKKLVEEVNTISQEKVSKLSVQEKNLSLASAEVQSVVEYTERCVSLSTDNEVMSMRTEIEKAIQQKIQEHNEAGRSLEPVEVADMGVEVRCAEALKQLCQTQAIITKLLIDPAKCTVDLPEHAEVGKLSTATLITRLSNNIQAKGNCTIFSQIKFLHNKVTTDCTIDEDESGKYSIQWTPTARGRHELTVLIDKQHVAGSPFPVFVSIHPAQLDTPVKIWWNLNAPVAITANSNGKFIIAERNGNILKFTVNGQREKLTIVKELVAMLDIACDDEDNIYCIDESSDKIFSCNKNGGYRRIHKVAMEMGASGRLAICINSNNRLIISEKSFKGAIKVYDQNLNYLLILQHKDVGQITGLSTDLQNTIYAADSQNYKVHVFSNNGSLLHSIGTLKHPWAVCVSGQYMYLTDVTNHCMFVFTTSGRHVSSFGRFGTSKEGKFNWPTSVCVDKDGFIFVCDLLNNRIQVF